MPGVNPVIELVKEPVPVPSVVFEFNIVGFDVVAQQIPFAVTADPPILVTCECQRVTCYICSVNITNITICCRW